MVPTLGIIAAGLGIPLYANQYINMLQLNGKVNRQGNENLGPIPGPGQVWISVKYVEPLY